MPESAVGLVRGGAVDEVDDGLDQRPRSGLAAVGRRQPRQPEVIARVLAAEREGQACDEVGVDAVEERVPVVSPGPRWGAEVDRVLARDEPDGLAAEDHRDLRDIEPGLEREAACEDRSVDRVPNEMSVP